jgi:hypothetical protein
MFIREDERVLDQLIKQAYENIEFMNCCHSDDRECDCSPCLRADFRDRPDEYNCPKKMNYYVAKYAASYSSEFYNYLLASQILNEFDCKGLRIISLGCGFAPDYYAINKYVVDHDLKVSLFYLGLDKSPYWGTARISYPNLQFELFDLTTPFSFASFDIVIMNKVFSTLLKNKQSETFIANLQNAIDTSMKPSALLIFIDVNSFYMGRDMFDNSIRKKFTRIRKYYTGNPPYAEPAWIKTASNEMIFPIIKNDKIDPLNEIRNFVYFEYRK